MPYIVGKATAYLDAAASSITVPLPPHQANDLLLVAVTNDGGGTAFSASGWTLIGTQAASQGIRHGWLYKIAASSSETDPTISGATDEWAALALVIRDVDTTTPIHASAKTDSLAPIASPSLTPTVDNCLLLYSVGVDGNNSRAVYLPDQLITVDRVDDSDNGGLLVGYHQQQSAGAAPSQTYHYANNSSTNDGGTCWVVAVKNATGGAIMPAMVAGAQAVVLAGAVSSDTDLTETALTSIASTIDGRTVDSNALTASTTLAYIPELVGGFYVDYSSAVSVADAWIGVTFALAATTDMTGKHILVEWKTGTSITTPALGVDGYLCAFADTSGNWAAFRLLKRADIPKINSPSTLVIAPGYTTPFASGGTINWAAISKFAIGYHRSGSVTNARAVGLKHVLLTDKPTLVAGSSKAPVTLGVYGELFSLASGHYKINDLQGQQQFFARTPIQIGNGARATYFRGLGGSLEKPSAYNYAGGQRSWNVAEGGSGVVVYASASDTIDFGGAVVY